MNKPILAAILTGSALALVVIGVMAVGPALGVGRTIRSGRVVEEVREVPGVTGVNLATIGHMKIEVGNANTLRIEAEENLLKSLTSEVEDSNLRIATERNVELRARRPVRYVLTVPSLDAIEISSNGDIEAGDLTGEDLTIRIRSNGDFVVDNVDAEALHIDISSSGDVTIDELVADLIDVDITSSGDVDISGGEVNRQTIDIGSAGTYDAPGLESDEADVWLTSNGSATIWVTDRLRATLSSSGDLRYGNPSVDASESSSGELIRIGE